MKEIAKDIMEEILEEISHLENLESDADASLERHPECKEGRAHYPYLYGYVTEGVKRYSRELMRLALHLKKHI